MDKERVTAEKIEKALNAQNIEALTYAFLWSGTQQGHDYWANRAYGRAPMSDNDWDVAKQEFRQTYSL